MGAPYSNGCHTCRKRHVKCDERRPDCGQCLRRNTKCLGYQKNFTFRAQTQKVTNRGRNKKKVENEVCTTVAPARRRQRSGNSPRQETIDENVAPSLVLGPIASQQKVAFRTFLYKAFPCLFGSFCDRVDLNWLVFINDRLESTHPALIWGLRSLNTYCLGKISGNQNWLVCSRHFYSRGLNCLARLLAQPSWLLRDETLGAAILLGVYEMLDGTAKSSWLQHSRGISLLMRLRGPAAHQTGFGHTLFISIRSFLVIDSFIRGEKCFFDDDEWKQVIDKAMEREKDKGSGGLLGDIAETAFKEIVRFPGFVADAQAINTGAGEPNNRTKGKLIYEMVSSRRILCDLFSLLPLHDTNYDYNTSFSGRIPAERIKPFMTYVTRGIHSGIVLLNQLLRSLDPNQNWILPWENVNGSQIRSSDEKSGCEIQRASSSNSEHTGIDWLDGIAMSMGMAGIEVGGFQGAESRTVSLL